MITSAANTGSYVRSAQAFASKTSLMAADAEPAAKDEKPPATQTPKLENADLGFRTIDVSQQKITPLDAGLRDLFATVCWEAQLAEPTDNAAQNIYATVKVDGKVVATLYNGGSSVMTNDAAEKVGDLRAPPGLSGGPDLAQWRATRIAEAMGGTVEKAPTATAPSESKSRQSTDDGQAQLAAALDASIAKQRPLARQPAGYAALHEPSGRQTDFSA